MRFFVIGNGPSLDHATLERLKGEQTVALNRIHLMYPGTDWRPTYYVKTDHNPRLLHVWQAETMLQIKLGIKCYLWDQFKDGLPDGHPNHATCPVGIGDFPNVVWVPRCAHHYYHHYSREDRRAKSWHFPEICTAYSGIGPAIQVAVLEGADEIVLLGCDLDYDGDTTHCHPEYKMPTHETGHYDFMEVTEAHKIAKKSSPVPIFNATPGGRLEVYERIAL